MSAAIPVAWLGLASVICMNPATGVTCLGMCVVSLVTSVLSQIVIEGGSGSGSAAENFSLGINPLASSYPVSYNITSNASLNNIFENTGLIFTGAYNVKQAAHNDLSRSDLEFNFYTIHFESTFGKHVAAHVNGGGHEELAQLILGATPGVSSGINNLTKRDNFNVDWVSYNYDNSNKDLSQDFLGEEYADAVSELGGDISTFMINNGGWK